jgi:hypothetical protein
MKSHYLSNIDLEQKIAFCAVCGITEIHVPKSRKKRQPRPVCTTRAGAHYENKLRPTRHILSDIDRKKLTAVCAICGPTDIREFWKNHHRYYECLTKTRNYMRVYKRRHYVARTTNPHALSNIDEEKETAICTTCGAVKIKIWRGRKKLNRRCINAGLRLE